MTAAARWRTAVVGTVAVVAIAAGSAIGAPPAAPLSPAPAAAGLFGRLATEIHARILAAAGRGGPVLVPPVAVAVHWKAQRIGTLDLGSPLVALAAADLDGDGKGELYAVTAREVVAIALGPKVHELARVPFVGDPAAAAPRDVVGTATRDGDAILASVSGFARGLRVHWRGGTLVGEPGAPGFALCPGEQATLSPGKNFFGDGATAIYAAQCRNGMVDPTGHRLRARGQVSVTGRLSVVVDRCDGAAGAAGAACAEVGRYELGGVGVAFELADLDRDGRPEAIVAGAGAPGDSDAIKIVTLGGDDKKPMFRHPFAGGVAGVVAVDNGGVLEVVAAVRLAGATRVDLWRLN